MRQPRVASAMLRPRRNWTRGVAAQHASLSRWRSPVRIRSGPPSPLFPYAPSARPDGASSCPLSALRPVKRGPVLVVLGLVALAVAVPVSRRASSASERRRAPRRLRRAPIAAGAAHRRPGRPQPRAVRDGQPPRPSGHLDAGAARRARRRRDRAGHQLPVHRRPRRPRRRSRPSWPARAPATTALELVDGEADAILAALGVEPPADPTPPRSSPGRGDPRDATSPRTASGWPSCARTRSGRRCARWPGATRRCSASTGSRPRRLAADRAAAGARRRPTPSTRRRPGPCSPAATSCSTAASPDRSRSRARAPTSRSTAAPPTSPAAASTARRSAGTCRTRSGPATPARSAT